MANCNRQQLNITCGTDVVLHDRLIFEGETFDPNLSVGIAANLVSSLGKRTALDVQVVDDELLISVPWIDGTLPGCYGLEVTGSCNSKKWATYADSLIKYTKATRIGVSEVMVESDSYDITQEVGYCYTDTPVSFAEVTVDEGYGTPSVDVEYEQRELRMDFHNLKGNGIANVEQTTTSTEDGGVNETTITMDNGGTTVMQVRNGRTGGTGPKGDAGDSAIFDPSTGNISTMKQTTGDDTLSPMSQKSVTEAVVSQVESKAEPMADLAFNDENNNAIVIFKDGHIKTKEFDSSDIRVNVYEEENHQADLTLEDEAGNAIAAFKYGHIITKNFNSKDVVRKSKYEGMRLSILGDSISTFGVPNQANATGTWTWPGNRCRYPQNNLFTNVKYQYWYLLLERLGMTLGINESWAGSRVSNTQATDSGDLGPNRCMSSLTRIGHLGENGTPDIILVYGGTNDAGAAVTVGTFNTENPINYTEEQIAALPVATFADAYRTMLIRLQYYYRTSRIICCFPTFTTSYYTIAELDKYGEVIREACDFFGVEYLDLRTAGITVYNRASYLPDGIHPNAAGMELIYEHLIRNIFN